MFIALVAGCVDAKPQPTQSKSDPNSLRDVRIIGRKNDDAPVPAIDPTKIEARDDIVGVNQYWGQDPWIRDPSTSRVSGFSVATYFVSSATEKGAFVKGDIVVHLNWLRTYASGEIERTPLYEWELNESQSMGFRIRKKSVMGYFYGLVLKWPETIDVSGKHIEIQISYRRLAGGAMVKSAPRTFRIEPAARHAVPHAARPIGAPH
ncbi:MAG: hypothetical protein JNG88_08910 [Phycisphaerales bacterium]|nr:hypothetical protein [Phycisphaerales bacterium]